MKVTIKNNIHDLELNDISNATVSFSFWQGRRFIINNEGSTVVVSLKDLQKAINKSQNKDLQELKNFRDELKTMRNRGYRKGEALKNSSIIIRIEARILHYFSKKTYDKLMVKLNRSFTQETLDQWNAEYDQIVTKHKNPKSKLKIHRISLFQETKAAAKNGYFLGDQLVNLDPNTTQNMIDGQERFENKKVKASPLPNPNYETIYEVADEDTLDLAESYINEGLNPLILNLANAYNPGGGVESGSGAQEESIFRRSNYHEALYPQAKTLYPIKKAEAIYTPSVQVFRTAEKNLAKDNQLDSYQYRAPFEVNMIACAALNLSDGDVPDNFEKMTRAKIRLILAVAVEKGHDSLVLGAMGCGVFKNDPEKISRYFKEALLSDEFNGRFKKVGFGIILNSTLFAIFESQFIHKQVEELGI